MNYNYTIYNYNYTKLYRSFEWFYIRQSIVLAGKIIDAPGKKEI